MSQVFRFGFRECALCGLLHSEFQSCETAADRCVEDHVVYASPCLRCNERHSPTYGCDLGRAMLRNRAEVMRRKAARTAAGLDAWEPTVHEARRRDALGVALEFRLNRMPRRRDT